MEIFLKNPWRNSWKNIWMNFWRNFKRHSWKSYCRKLWEHILNEFLENYFRESSKESRKETLEIFLKQFYPIDSLKESLTEFLKIPCLIVWRKPWSNFGRSPCMIFWMIFSSVSVGISRRIMLRNLQKFEKEKKTWKYVFLK